MKQTQTELLKLKFIHGDKYIYLDILKVRIMKTAKNVDYKLPVDSLECCGSDPGRWLLGT